jgi:hypothetical protein
MYKYLISNLEIVSEHLFELKLKAMGATVNEAIEELKKIEKTEEKNEQIEN